MSHLLMGETIATAGLIVDVSLLTNVTLFCTSEIAKCGRPNEG